MVANFITVYTDASVCPNHQCGGWAAWIKYGDGNVLKASSPFRNHIMNGCSTVAELYAIANAIAVVNKAIKPKDAIIVVVTDCQLAIDVIAGKGYTKDNPLHKEVHAVAAAIKRAVINGCSLRLKKVKAHSSSDGRRSFVNSVVDMEARSSMNAARRSLASKKGKVA